MSTLNDYGTFYPMYQSYSTSEGSSHPRRLMTPISDGLIPQAANTRPRFVCPPPPQSSITTFAPITAPSSLTSPTSSRSHFEQQAAHIRMTTDQMFSSAAASFTTPKWTPPKSSMVPHLGLPPVFAAADARPAYYSPNSPHLGSSLNSTGLSLSPEQGRWVSQLTGDASGLDMTYGYDQAYSPSTSRPKDSQLVQKLEGASQKSGSTMMSFLEEGLGQLRVASGDFDCTWLSSKNGNVTPNPNLNAHFGHSVYKSTEYWMSRPEPSSSDVFTASYMRPVFRGRPRGRKGHQHSTRNGSQQ